MTITDPEAPEAPKTFADAQDVLAQNLKGYGRRAHQMALAEKVEDIIAGGRHGLLQAGTGTGKSIALLIPAILSGIKTVIATATKALQYQYSSKDLPFLAEHLGVPFTWAVIMGRANYPCLVKAGEITAPTPGQAKVIARVKELSTAESARDLVITTREDFPELPEAEWSAFSMSSDECPGVSSCPFGELCLADRAKTRAAEADVVITNTAYLLRDLRLRDMTDGNVQLLGDIGQVFIDEGHTLRDAATSALEATLGEWNFISLGRNMAGYVNREDPEGLDLNIALAEGIEPAANGLWSVLGLAYADWMSATKSKAGDPMPLVQKKILEEFGVHFEALNEAIGAAHKEIKTRNPQEDKQKLAKARILRRSLAAMNKIADYMLDGDDKTVRWMQVDDRGDRRRLLLCSAPVSVGPFLRGVLWDKIPTTLVSATLAPGGDFGFSEDQVGLDLIDDDGDRIVRYDAGTPFNYRKQAILFTPDRDQPSPAQATKASWRAYMQAATREMVNASEGGALLLFTSRAEMNASYDALAAGFRRRGLNVMRQGDTTTGQLVRAMKEDQHSVLFALRTFFEGVDIQGDALRLVVIDKLPFTPPTDLVHQARENAVIAKHGGRSYAAFTHLAVPEMTLVLLQAFGRLIRTVEDRGVVAILDSRLNSKAYGKEIVKRLPPAAQTTDIDMVTGALARIAPAR